MVDLQSEVQCMVDSLGLAKLRESVSSTGDAIPNGFSYTAGDDKGRTPSKNKPAKIARDGRKRSIEKSVKSGQESMLNNGNLATDRRGSTTQVNGAVDSNSRQRRHKRRRRQVNDETEDKQCDDDDDDNNRPISNRKRRKGSLKNERRGMQGNYAGDGVHDNAANDSDEDDLTDMKHSAKRGKNSTGFASVVTATLWHKRSLVTRVDDTDGRHAVLSPAQITALKQEAHEALAQHTELYKKDGGGFHAASQWRWMQTVLATGTLSDKLAVRQTMLREAPEFNVPLLDDTVKMAAGHGKAHAMVAMTRLTEMFTGFLLPPARLLLPFGQQPLHLLPQISNATDRRQQLILWLFEDRLRQLYSEFVHRSTQLAHDSVQKTRKLAVTTLCQLLINHPQHEQVLLESLVNKLGDEKKAVSCLTVRRLGLVVRRHPAMRLVVVKEVERVLFRSNVSKRAQFYGICFLTQLPFSDSEAVLSNDASDDRHNDETNLAQRLVNIYIGFFKAGVKQAQLDGRLMRALLAGLAACCHHCRLLQHQLRQYEQPLYHIIQLSSCFGVVTQALRLVFQLATTAVSSSAAGQQAQTALPSDRYYTTLYKKVYSCLTPSSSPSAGRGAAAVTSSHTSDFLNLLYRSLLVDSCQQRVRAFVKRLLQCCCYQSSELVCGVLLLISELYRSRDDLCSQHSITDTDTDPALSGPRADLAQDSDDEEHPQDVELSDDEGGEAGSHRPQSPASDSAPGSQKAVCGWTFRSSGAGDGSGSGVNFSDEAAVTMTEAGMSCRLHQYSWQHRDPRWCRAELRPLADELATLRRHFHPSVAVFASRLAALLAPPSGGHTGAVCDGDGRFIDYAGNPLEDFRLMHFLNRFCYRNPKKGGGGGSIKQLPVTSAQYGSLPDGQVPSDERFFHSFFSARQHRVVDSQQQQHQQATSEANCGRDVSDEMFDEFLEQTYGRRCLQSSRNSYDDDDELDDSDGDEEEQEKQADFARGLSSAFAPADGEDSDNDCGSEDSQQMPAVGRNSSSGGDDVDNDDDDEQLDEEFGAGLDDVEQESTKSQPISRQSKWEKSRCGGPVSRRSRKLTRPRASHKAGPSSKRSAKRSGK